MGKRIYLKSKKKRIGLSKLSGKWVAFIDETPVLWDENLSLLMQKVKEKSLPKEPSVMLITRLVSFDFWNYFMVFGSITRLLRIEFPGEV